MSEQPLISVIVPVYKVEPYLDRCVQSIVDQTYTNLEIILVDDGSPDNCPAMCDAWAEKDARIKVIHKENGGLSDARNAGLAVASGDYIAFVDSDDWVHLDYLSQLHTAIHLHDAKLAACQVRFVYDEDALPVIDSATKKVLFSPEQALETLILGTGFRAVAWNKLYHRSLLEGELFEVGRYHEDEFFTYRILAKAERLVFVDAELYYYLQRPGSIMNSASIKHLDALDAYLERLKFFHTRFPALYRKDKITICICCVHFYRDVLQLPDSLQETGKRRVRQCRKQLRFTIPEMAGCSLRHLLYIFGSRFCMDLLCRLLNWKRKN